MLAIDFTFVGLKLVLLSLIILVGRINSMIYPVEGGMEDWLYAAGWDHTNGILRNCSRSGTAGEPDWTLLRPENRALVFLAETSNAKNPPIESLGGSFQVPARESRFIYLLTHLSC